MSVKEIRKTLLAVEELIDTMLRKMDEAEPEPEAELLPCPLCGQEPEVNVQPGFEGEPRCINHNCLICFHGFRLVQWQAFPRSFDTNTLTRGYVIDETLSEYVAAHPVRGEGLSRNNTYILACEVYQRRGLGEVPADYRGEA